MASVVLAVCVWLLWPAESLARALVRFIDALPGLGRVSVEVSTRRTLERLAAIAFAQSTKWRSLRAGGFHWSLVQHDKVLAHGAAKVANGAYDLVLLAPEPGEVRLGVFRARRGVRGVGLVRMIHAAPELGSPELKLGGAVVSRSLSFGASTRYVRLAPGRYKLAALAPGNPEPLVAVPRLRIGTGRAYSEILVGTRGERLRWVTVVDRGAPLTRATAGSRQKVASGRYVVVAPGDSLWTIAARQLGRGASDDEIYQEVVAIWRINARRIGTGDPNLIFPGQVLSLPLAATM